MENTPCEIELEKIKKKARQRHERYLKNKDKVKKIPLKRDIIIKLSEEIISLRKQLMEAQNNNTEPKNGTDTLEDEALNGIIDDEIDFEAEEEIGAEAEAEAEIEAEAEAEAEPFLESIYDVKDDFEDINPTKEKVCKCENNYTYEVINERMENMEWGNDRIKKTMIDTMEKLYELFDRIPTCKGSIDKFYVGLLGLNIPDTKKRVMMKILLLAISKLNIELDDNMIGEYYSLYSMFV